MPPIHDVTVQEFLKLSDAELLEVETHITHEKEARMKRTKTPVSTVPVLMQETETASTAPMRNECIAPPCATLDLFMVLGRATRTLEDYMASPGEGTGNSQTHAAANRALMDLSKAIIKWRKHLSSSRIPGCAK